MSEDGKNITAMMQQLRRLCEEISLLLGTADTLIANEGWKTTGNTCLSVSYTLAYPRFWIPREFFRFYKKTDLGQILIFISVLLDNAENESHLQASLLTAGWFDYGPGHEVGNQWQSSYARWHLQMPERNDEGILLSVDDSKVRWPKEPFVRVSTLGVPLTSVVNTEGLKNKIIEPLVQGIKAAQGKNP